MPRDLDQPLYPVGARRISPRELLAVFLDHTPIGGGIPRCSDLHVTVGEPVHFRVDGDLVPMPGGGVVTTEVAEGLVGCLLDAEDHSRFHGAEKADVDAGFAWEESGLNFRINAFHDRRGPALVLRVLPNSVPTLAEVGFPEAKTPEEIARLSQGLVLVTGVTGSGKSTTIASLLNHIAAQRPVRIITLEDPVEYLLPSGKALISQREVGRHVRSFADGLRSALREDPDIIHVGEIRDRETAALALTAAETGHLVLSTLHTRDTRGAITRLVDLFPAERSKELCAQISFALSFVIGQRLCSRMDGGGRRAAFEVLRNTLAIANLIRSGHWHQLYSVMETHQREGMCTLERHLSDLAKSGQISREEAIAQSNDPALLARLLP